MSESMYEKMESKVNGLSDPNTEQLIKALANGNCVLFAGSGISRRCLARNRQPLPNWRELLKLLFSEAINNDLVSTDTIRDLEVLFRKNEYLMIAEELLEVLSKPRVQQIINEILDPDGIVPSKLHELLSITPFRFRITTNYDNLLERAYIETWNRHVDRVCLDELERLYVLVNQGSDFCTEASW